MKLLASGDLDEDMNGGLLHNAQSRQVLMQKLSRDGVGFNPGGMNYPSLPSLTTPNPTSIPNSITNIANMYGNSNQPIYNNNGQLINPQMAFGQVAQSNCVLLSNLFDQNVDLVQEPNFFSEIYEDVYEECSQFGKIILLWIDEKSPGNIWVKFDNSQYASLAFDKLNGRYIF